MSGFATPMEGLLGGISLGLLTVGRLLIHGKILGISGHVRGVLKGSPDKSRGAHLIGLAAGGVGLAFLAPGCFGPLPATFTVGRAAIAGLLVGSGAALGNGCTSGHGLCGNARLSPRSMLFTIIIIATGAATARLSGTAEALGFTKGTPEFRLPTAIDFFTGVALVGATAAVLGSIAAFARRQGLDDVSVDVGKEMQLGLAADVAEGALFAAALGYAGMTDPRKVAAFLSITPAGFDYSLMFVMGGGVLVAMGPFLSVFWRKEPSKSLTGGPMPVVKNTVDSKLILGAVLFGAGWGLGGLCPGPAIAALPTLSKQVLVFSTAAAAAMFVVP